MNVVLINPPLRTQDLPVYYPIGICYIASYLRQNGHKVKILDINGFRWSKTKFKKIFDKEPVEAVGIGGLVTAFNHVHWLSDCIKSVNPNVPIFAGNTVASTIPEILLKNTKVDIVVMGEGEVTTLELIQRLEDGKSLEGLKGVWYKNNDGKIVENPPREPIENLDSLPFPAWDLVPMERYLKNLIASSGYSSAPISTVRGCPYNCTFCCKTFIGYSVRSRSPENCIQEIKLLVDKYEIEGFLLFDDLFIYNKQRAMRFCDLLIEEGLDYLKWPASARANLITKELAQKMKSAGCAWLGFGFESSSQKILDYYNKQCTVEDQQRAIDICKEVDIGCRRSYMIGAAVEDEQSIKETVEFCKKNKSKYVPDFFVMPLPKTKIYAECKRRELIKDELEYVEKISTIGDASNFVINITEKFSDEELINLFNSYHKETMRAPDAVSVSERIHSFRKLGIMDTFRITKFALHRKLKKESSANEWI
jgi:anaerobic magnesium-protoporphyrin IX monomethyl ester cyclase